MRCAICGMFLPGHADSCPANPANKEQPPKPKPRPKKQSKEPERDREARPGRNRGLDSGKEQP